MAWQYKIKPYDLMRMRVDRALKAEGGAKVFAALLDYVVTRGKMHAWAKRLLQKYDIDLSVLGKEWVVDKLFDLLEPGFAGIDEVEEVLEGRKLPWEEHWEGPRPHIVSWAKQELIKNYPMAYTDEGDVYPRLYIKGNKDAFTIEFSVAEGDYRGRVPAGEVPTTVVLEVEGDRGQVTIEDPISLIPDEGWMALYATIKPEHIEKVQGAVAYEQTLGELIEDLVEAYGLRPAKDIDPHQQIYERSLLIVSRKPLDWEELIYLGVDKDGRHYYLLNTGWDEHALEYMAEHGIYFYDGLSKWAFEHGYECKFESGHYDEAWGYQIPVTCVKSMSRNEAIEDFKVAVRLATQ